MKKRKKTDQDPIQNNKRNFLAIIGGFLGVMAVMVLFSVLALKYLAPSPTVKPSVLQTIAQATMNLAMPLYVDETIQAELPARISGTLTAIAPTPSPIPPTPTVPVIPCNLAGFVSDETIPDGTSLSSASAFTKVWKVRNIGTCVWSENYSLVFSGGELMAGQSPLTIGRELNPGDTIELSANLVAPVVGGVYNSQWMLQDNQGTQFGIYPDNQPLKLHISVGLHETIALDFTDQVCAGKWNSPLGNLECPNPNELTLGSVNPFQNTVGEYGEQIDDQGIEVVPSEGREGSITGTFNLLLIQDGDSFHTIIGCADNQPNCDLVFELQADSGDQQPVTLGKWIEITDGAFQKVDVDLSSLSGKAVRLILNVISGSGTGQENKGLWIAPVVFRILK